MTLIIDKDLGSKPITKQNLHTLITQWIHAYKHLEKSHLFTYKYKLQKILPLPHQFFINSIIYTFYTNFPFLVEDFNQEDKIRMNLQLKQFYSNQFYNGKWKKQFIFQFTTIFLTKTISKFISQHFSNLQINQNLQSQIFIILYKVFIGTQIGTKLYNLTAKKYLKITDPQISKITSEFKPSICISSQNKNSIFTIGSSVKHTTKYISEFICSQNQGITKRKIPEEPPSPNNKSNDKKANNLMLKSNPNRQKISFSRSRFQFSHQKQNLQNFTQNLKENLYVEPLPVIEQTKYDISDYEKIKLRATLRQTHNQFFQQSKLKKYQISSLKKSQSVDTCLFASQFKKQTQESLKKNQGTKLNLTRQLNLKNFINLPLNKKKQSFFQKSIKLIKQSEKQKSFNFGETKNTYQYQNYSKKSLQRWKEIIQQMKCSSKNSQRQNVLMKTFSQGQKCFGNSLKQTFSKEQNNNPPEIQKIDTLQNIKTSGMWAFSKLKTQCNERATIYEKKLQISEQKNSQQNRFTKLDIFTTTSGSAFKALQNRSSQIGKKRRASVKIQKTCNYQKQSELRLTKTNKLKLAKLQFLTSCKKREQKLEQQAQLDNVKVVFRSIAR